MGNQSISSEIMEYMVWVVELVSSEFFLRDKTVAYLTLKECGLWDIYVDHFDITHTLGKESLLDEIREYFSEHGVLKSC